MIADCRGDMGFMEAMVSMIAVSVVIGMYVALVATASAAAYSPLEDFDVDSLDADISDGVRVSESYLHMYLGSTDIRGLSVAVSIPFFDEDEGSFSVGDTDGDGFSKRYVRVLDYENGRSVPAVIEVAAFL